MSSKKHLAIFVHNYDVEKHLAIFVHNYDVEKHLAIFIHNYDVEKVKKFQSFLSHFEKKTFYDRVKRFLMNSLLQKLPIQGGVP